MILALVTATTVSTVDVPQSAYGRIVDSRQEVTLVQANVSEAKTEEIVRSYFQDIPVLIEIARCESTFTHELSDGTILRGKVDPADTGVMQINKRYHSDTAATMQLNLDDLYHNMAYARHLYETQGTQPWSASMSCWGNSLAMNY